MRMRRLLPLLLALLFGGAPDRSEAVQSGRSPAAAPARLRVFVSDLHFGIGKSGNTWHPTEDFRWSQALQGFLREIATRGDNRVDLVITGDFLELWQPPDELRCKGKSADLGCTVEEMEKMADAVVAAHRDDFAALGRFANQGDNRVYVIPGNHDAALLLDSVWEPVAAAFQASPPERLVRVKEGVWVSPDGAIVAEHGHQITPDVNRYDRWPEILRDGYLQQPWGEYFVRTIFNDEEKTYSIIDNLASGSGVKYRIIDRGLVGSAQDSARFLRYVLFQTSLSQKAEFLDSPATAAVEPVWDLERARGFKHLLFADAMDPEDPFRGLLLTSQEKSWVDLRGELAALSQDKESFPNEEVQGLCNQIAIRKQQNPRADLVSCEPPKLGYVAHKAHLVSRDAVLRRHINARLQEPPYKKMRLFVYGHTHAIEEPWRLRVQPYQEVTIVNTGAFQRLIDDEKLTADADPVVALRSMRVEALPPCYSAVLVTYRGSRPVPELKNWLFEGDGNGRFVSPCDSRCAKISKNCK